MMDLLVSRRQRVVTNDWRPSHTAPHIMYTLFFFHKHALLLLSDVSFFSLRLLFSFELHGLIWNNFQPSPSSTVLISCSLHSSIDLRIEILSINRSAVTNVLKISLKYPPENNSLELIFHTRLATTTTTTVSSSHGLQVFVRVRSSAVHFLFSRKCRMKLHF